MQDLKITLIQPALHWENAEENLCHFESVIQPFKQTTDLIILPEMFSTGFSMNAESLAEEMNGTSMQWMQRTAEETGAVITGSLIIKEAEKYFNRLIWMRPDGTHEHYDKRHLFGLGDEHKHYSAGKERIIVSLNGWNICPLVCYDLRFPVWCRISPQSIVHSQQLKQNEGQNFDKSDKPNMDDGRWTVDKQQYDLLLFVANWPERRNFAWKHLLQARAIENQSYVAGVNRIGNDGNNIYHSGDSSLVSPLGEVIFTQADTAFAKTFALSKEQLNAVREKMPFLRDADNFEVRQE